MRKRSEAREPRETREVPEFQVDVPHDPINEQVIIASMFADREARGRLVKLFPPEAFYAKEHRVIVAGVHELDRLRLDFDPATLSRVAPDADMRIVESLAASRPDLPSNLEFHVETLKWDWQRAQTARGPLATLLEAFQDPKAAPERTRAIARSLADSLDQAAKGGARYLRDSGEVVAEMMAALRKRVEGEAHYPFGIEGLDFNEAGERRLRPGAAPGLTTILTGMSGAGKTTLAAHIILGLARQRRRVLVGAWEVRAPMTLELVTTLSLKWSRSRILDGKTNELRYDAPMSEEEMAVFEDQGRKISKYVTFVENPFQRGSVRTKGKVTNDDYLDILEEHVEISGCDVAIFDLFDRCLRHRRPDDEQEALWRTLEFTNYLQIHTILVHQQLLKGDDVRADKRPSLAGLKGSSAYVDAGAAVIAPHLPARFKQVPDNTMEVFGLKQRYGAPFAVEFDWDPDRGQISGGRDMPFDARTDDETAAAIWGPKKRKGK